MTLPKPLKTEDEAAIEMMRGVMMRTYREFKEEYCDKEGNQKTNLTKDGEKGLKELQKRIKEGEILVIKTDKSGKLAVTDKENYLELGRKHIEKDRIIERKELRKIERELNGRG